MTLPQRWASPHWTNQWQQLVDLLVEHWKDIPQEFQSKLGLKIGLVLSN